MEESHRFSVHHALGGGAVADVILWRKLSLSAAFLVVSTALWFLFERAGYNLLSFISNVLLLLIVILFFWAKSASILNRPLPPLPNLELSEETSVKAADEMRVWVNYVLSIAHDIAVDGNWRLFLKVATILWVISCIGSFFNFLTLIYIGVLLSLSLPVLYDKYQNPIDDKLSVACNIARIQYQKIDSMVLQKIPLPSNKEKKTQ
ncbi:Reticulon family protein [Perilla frutescens var. hirtella]|uniref:Reticulon-like protein n=1 Tax=Perilla frutescens var. hirtella TaxID=608512 RepID=A0AAD4JJM9_PERFH|nr:Reticulon family protein [Perilla frutescens var. hirtella]